MWTDPGFATAGRSTSEERRLGASHDIIKCQCRQGYRGYCGGLPPRTAEFEVGLVISLLSLGSEEGVLGRHSSTLRFSIGSLEIIESLAVNLAMTESWEGWLNACE